MIGSPDLGEAQQRFAGSAALSSPAAFSRSCADRSHRLARLNELTVYRMRIRIELNCSRPRPIRSDPQIAMDVGSVAR
jgi:hypothetical protein